MLDILILSPWLPWPPHDGARIRISETLRFLAANHRVSLVTALHSTEERAHVPDLAEFCDRIEAVPVRDGVTARLSRVSKGIAAGLAAVEAFHHHAEMARCVRELSVQRSFDIVQAEFSFLTHYLRRLDSRQPAKLILSMHNIESVRFDRELERIPWNLRHLLLAIDRGCFGSWEQRAIQSVHGVAAVSENDRAWIERHTTAPVALVPNGVDLDYFQPRAAAQASALVFTGAMNYPPNADAVVWFANQILPLLRERLPRLCFKIVGSQPLREVQALAQRPGIWVTGRVDDVRPYIAEALAFVVPLRSGGGTRLKILQAMAMASPVVSTTVGAEGLAVRDGTHVLLADDPETFVERIAALAASPELGMRLGRAGRQLALARYGWQRCLAGLENLYEAVLSGGRP